MLLYGIVVVLQSSVVIAIKVSNMLQIQICVFCSFFVITQIYIKLYVNCRNFTKMVRMDVLDSNHFSLTKI